MLQTWYGVHHSFLNIAREAAGKSVGIYHPSFRILGLQYYVMAICGFKSDYLVLD